MFGIGSTELLVILLVGLIVLGPKSLASLSRTIGKVVGEFRRVSTDFQRTLNAEAAAEEHAEKVAKMSAEEKAKQQAEDSAAIKRQEQLNARKEAAVQKANEAKAAKENSNQTLASEQTPQTQVSEDSPLAKAIKAAHAEAEAFEKSTQEKKSTSAS